MTTSCLGNLHDVLETGDGNIRVVASSETTGEEEVSSSTPDGVVD